MTNNQTQPKDTRSFFEKGLHWPVSLVLLFCISASIVLTTAIIGAGKGSQAVEPDYYARSVDWDSEKERLQTAQRLGWDIRISASKPLDEIGSRLVSVMLIDAEENPIEGAMIEITSFAQMNAHDPITQIFPDAGAGQYQSRLPSMSTDGLWEFRISIRHAGHQALVIKSLDLKS